MNMTIGCPIPGASQMSYPESLVNVTHWMLLPKPPEEPHD